MYGAITQWRRRRWAVAAATTALAALVIGVPTGIVETSFYTRMTPVTWWDYPVWAVSSLLIGLTAATYVRGAAVTASPAGDRRPRTLLLTLLSIFAVGCPICNKLVVTLIGISGALNYFAPIQPLIGVAAVALSSWALWIRYRALRDPTCPLPGAT